MTKGRIPLHMYPFYRVYDEKGNQYCDCGWEEDAIRLCILNEDVQELTYHRVDPPS